MINFASSHSKAAFLHALIVPVKELVVSSGLAQLALQTFLPGIATK
jgi:hypothetical protein